MILRFPFIAPCQISLGRFLFFFCLATFSHRFAKTPDMSFLSRLGKGGRGVNFQTASGVPEQTYGGKAIVATRLYP